MEVELKPCICGAPVDQEECPYPQSRKERGTGRQIWVVNCTNGECGWQAIGWGADGASKAWNTRHVAGDADRSAELTTAWMAGAESVRDRNAEDAARWRAWRELDEHAAADIAWRNAGAERDAAIDEARAGERG